MVKDIKVASFSDTGGSGKKSFSAQADKYKTKMDNLKTDLDDILRELEIIKNLLSATDDDFLSSHLYDFDKKMRERINTIKELIDESLKSIVEKANELDSSVSGVLNTGEQIVEEAKNIAANAISIGSLIGNVNNTSGTAKNAYDATGNKSTDLPKVTPTTQTESTTTPVDLTNPSNVGTKKTGFAGVFDFIEQSKDKIASSTGSTGTTGGNEGISPKSTVVDNGGTDHLLSGVSKFNTQFSRKQAG